MRGFNKIADREARNLSHVKPVPLPPFDFSSHLFAAITHAAIYYDSCHNRITSFITFPVE